MGSSVDDALSAWEKAPAHVRMMAGAYVGPLLAALVESDSRIARCEAAIQEIIQGGALHGES